VFAAISHASQAVTMGLRANATTTFVPSRSQLVAIPAAAIDIHGA
jgi:hypothetical protein